MGRDSDDIFLTMAKTRDLGKRSRFSDFFDSSPLVASKNQVAPRREASALPGLDPTYSTMKRNVWCMDALESAIQPIDPCMANVVSLLEKSVWNIDHEEIAHHVRTTSEERQYRKQLDPIGTPAAKRTTNSPQESGEQRYRKQLDPIGTPAAKRAPSSPQNSDGKQYRSHLDPIGAPAAKRSTSSSQESECSQQMELSEQEIREILSRNWEAPQFNPLTAGEVTWLMRLNDANQLSPNSSTAAVDEQEATQTGSANSRNVSADSSVNSLSPEPSRSVVVSANGTSPATSASTTGAAQAKKAQSICFTNAEAQAQQQREIDIANMKEQRARAAVMRPPPMPMTMPVAALVPPSGPATRSVSTARPVVLSGSRLPPSTASAAPFVPSAAMRTAGPGEADDELVSFLQRRLREVQIDLEKAKRKEAGP